MLPVDVSPTPGLASPAEFDLFSTLGNFAERASSSNISQFGPIFSSSFASTKTLPGYPATPIFFNRFTNDVPSLNFWKGVSPSSDINLQCFLPNSLPLQSESTTTARRISCQEGPHKFFAERFQEWTAMEVL